MVEFKGLDEFTKWADTVPKEIESDVRELVTETALRIEADAKMLAPVDLGLLQGSIATSFDIGSRGTEAEVGTNVEYAMYVEYGTSKMSEQPFLIPAYLNHRDRYTKALTEILRKAGK